MGKNKKYKKVFPCQFPKDLYEKLRELAIEEDRSIGNVIRLAITHYLKARKRI